MNKEIKYYRVLSSKNADTLQEMVNNMIHAGFQPLGGAAMAYDNDFKAMFYSQAVVTYEEVEQ